MRFYLIVDKLYHVIAASQELIPTVRRFTNNPIINTSQQTLLFQNLQFLSLQEKYQQAFEIF